MKPGSAILCRARALRVRTNMEGRADRLMRNRGKLGGSPLGQRSLDQALALTLSLRCGLEDAFP